MTSEDKAKYRQEAIDDLKSKLLHQINSYIPTAHTHYPLFMTKDDIIHVLSELISEQTTL